MGQKLGERRGRLPKAPRNTYWRGIESGHPILWGRIKIAGRKYRWSLRTNNVATAKRRVDEERKRLIGEAHFGEVRHSYREVFSEWGAHIATQVSATTAARYACSLKMLEPDLIDLFIDEIDKATCQAIVKRRRTDGVSTATIRRDLTALSSVLEFAETQDYREGNPALTVLKNLVERRDPIVLPTHENIERVYRRAPQMMAAIARAALATGCRMDELVKAERANLDHERRQLLVRGKGNKVRPIDLDAPTYAILRTLPVNLGCRYLFWMDDGQPFKDLSSAFRYVVRAELREAQKVAQENGAKEPDFRRFTFHHLRHRFAVDWLKSGRSIYDLQKHLGHTSVKTTEIYLDFLTAEEQRRVMLAASQIGPHIDRFKEAESA